jgi:arylsulfatase A-like enzyme
LEIADNTVVIFTSDQGPVSIRKGKSSRQYTSCLPLRGGKGHIFEGGIRVPLIIKWPQQAQAGRVSETMTISTDLYPTILEMTGLPLDETQHADGISILPSIKGETVPFARDFTWAYPHGHASGQRPSLGIRSGAYKLIYWLENHSVKLFNIETDIGEVHDLSQTHPETAQMLLDKMAGIDPMRVLMTSGKK